MSSRVRKRCLFRQLLVICNYPVYTAASLHTAALWLRSRGHVTISWFFPVCVTSLCFWRFFSVYGRGHRRCFIVIGVLGKRVKQQEKRMWKPRAWSKEATEEMSGFGKRSSPPAFQFWRALWPWAVLDSRTLSCLWGGTGEPAQGWAQQKWATRGGGRSPQEEGTAAPPGQCWTEESS